MRRMTLALGLSMALAAAAVAVPAQAQFSGEEEQAIRDIVREYLIDNPEVLVEALQEYQARQQIAEAERQQESVARMSAALFDSDAPSWGPADADVVLVEFFDYNCGYCKRSLPDIQALMESQDNLRIVFMEIPILAPSSEVAARAALAARNQGLYIEMHNALMSHRGELSEAVILQIAGDVGLDVEQLRQDMAAPEIAAEIAANLDLAETIGVRGTPAFVIGDRVIPGAVGLAALEAAIAQEMEGS